MAKASKRQFLVTIKPPAGGTIPGLPTTQYYFSQKTGGATTATLQKVFDGGAQNPTVLPGVAETSDLVLSRPYDPTIDQPLITALKGQVGRLAVTVTVQPTDANFIPVGGLETYNAILAGVTPSEVDAASSDAAVFSLTFAVGSVS